MGATPFGFLMTASIALFTVFSIIFGYMLLQNAIISIAEQSSYYTYVSIIDTMQRAMDEDHAGASKLRLIPRYALFFASFDNEDDIYFFEPDSTGYLETTTKGNECNLFNRLKTTSSGKTVYNEGLEIREELTNCVGETCFCIAELSAFLVLDKEEFMADTCYKLCWGDDITLYDDCLNPEEGSIKDNFCSSSEPPVDIINECNERVADKHPDGQCAACVNYLNKTYEKGEQRIGLTEVEMEPGFGKLTTEGGHPGLRVVNQDFYSVLLLDNEDADIVEKKNKAGYELLKEFSEATKFAFASEVIECRPLSGFGTISGGDSGFCYIQNQEYIPYLTYYLSDYDTGLWTILSTSQKRDDIYYPHDTVFEIFNTAFNVDSLTNPGKCYWYPSSIQSEEAGGVLTDVFGGIEES